MGMAASQARFLSLVARKNNVEYEGQQINQQRTALSATSASHYSDLLGMAVPVCPSVEDFTKTIYSFTDGALTNSITSLIAQGDGSYKASYLCSYVDDFAVVSAGATSVVNTATGAYMVGADKLKALGQDLEWDYVLKEGFSEYRLTENPDNTYSYTDIFNQPKTLIPATEDVIIAVIGNPPDINNYKTDALVKDYTATGCYSQVLQTNGVSKAYHMEHNLCFIMWADGRDSITYNDVSNPNNPKNGLVMTKTNDSNRSVAGYGSSTASPTQNQLDLQEILEKYYPDLYQQLTNLYIDCVLSLDSADYVSLKKNYYTLEDKNGVMVSGNDAGVNYDFEDTAIGTSARSDYDQMQAEWLDLWAKVSNVNYSVVYESELKTWNEKANPYRGNYVDADDYTKIYSLTEQKMFYDGQNSYLKSLSSDQLENLYETEVDFKDLLNEKVCTPDSDWYVRYVQNSATGEWEPIFYNGDEISTGIADEYSNIRSSVQAYKLGSKQVQNEIKGRTAVMEQDSTGRYINITFVGDNGENTTYALTTSTITDNDAYNDAMNQYEYDKAIYDQNIEEINAKIAIIQSEDKNLELRLKQLDTEHDALSNEMDAVQKVIEKNVESGFKTFG